MPSNFTENFNLSQWEPGDKVQRTDFNADNAKIDAALKAEAAAQAALAAQVAKCGNCSISTLTYTGNGKFGPDNPTKLYFPRRPTAFFGYGGSALLSGLGDGSPIDVLTNTSRGTMYNLSFRPSWSGSVCSFYSTEEPRLQMNHEVNYFIIAFYAES